MAPFRHVLAIVLVSALLLAQIVFLVLIPRIWRRQGALARRMGILDERMTYTTLTPACAVVAALLDHDVYVFVTGCVFFWGILSFIAIFLVLRSIELREGF